MIQQIIHNDCLIEMEKIESKSIDFILTDLPYSITARNSWDIIIPFDKLWEQYERIIKDNSAIVLTAVQPFASKLVMSNEKLFKYEWIWEKTKATGFLNAKKQPLRNHEQILVFYKSQPTYNPQGIKECLIECDRGSEEGVGTNYSKANPKYTQTQTGYPRSIQKFQSEGKTLHPTQKPLKLFEWLIKTYTNEGDLVLDSCCGSGTTCLAAKKLNRQFIGIEKEEKYFNIAKIRLNL